MTYERAPSGAVAIKPREGQRDVLPQIANRFHTLILQPTTLCNLDCAYCYLPFRAQQRLMSPAVAAACAESILIQDSPYPVDVVWHGGEPTATPIDHFQNLIQPFERARRSGAIRHAIQTNATLIDESWCELLRHYDFQVGVSIDGPRARNAHRVNRVGRESWDQTMRGVRLIREAGIQFTAICVVSPQTIDQADELAEFFEDFGCESVGFNIEEEEGTGRPPVDEGAAFRFWQQVIKRRLAGSQLRIRDVDRLTGYLGTSRRPGSTQSFDPIPTISYDGDTVLLSPELLGIRDTEYGDFVAGNVLTDPLPRIIARASELRYVVEFSQALSDCARSCEYFKFCQGAQAGNRYFEHSNFKVAETRYCRTTKQTLVRAAASELLGEEVKV